METYHVLPINDIIEHIETEKCYCDPEIREEYDNRVIIHNSYDRREDFE